VWPPNGSDYNSDVQYDHSSRCQPASRIMRRGAIGSLLIVIMEDSRILLELRNDKLRHTISSIFQKANLQLGRRTGGMRRYLYNAKADIRRPLMRGSRTPSQDRRLPGALPSPSRRPPSAPPILQLFHVPGLRDCQACRGVHRKILPR
jgi:hypothetical protein